MCVYEHSEIKIFNTFEWFVKNIWPIHWELVSFIFEIPASELFILVSLNSHWEKNR